LVRTRLPAYWRYIDIGIVMAFILMLLSLGLFGWYLFLVRGWIEWVVALASLMMGLVAIFVTIILSILTIRSIKAELR
jgi:hypothetical protein